MPKKPHRHRIKHWPLGGTGYAVCSCGGTRRIENGRAKGAWHTCHLCVR